MLELKNVSKFYHNKGNIASGFVKVNLKLEMGEFVAITGESGSGKSTLLNVISGLDSYEEGELYINGEETSHYNKIDFEKYRKKYIANIFQNFNLINSYTVYQNVELVLLLNGFKRRDIKNKIHEILKNVDILKFKNSKVSKLSGGQKQRVAIARALAKDSPIIVADEPTGNLDSASAKSIVQLLHKISKEKLIVIVTHNYDQIEPYVTRKITMHDGKILEDKKIKNKNNVKKVKTPEYKNLSFLNKIRLGLRNTFNIVPKFILLLAVLFLVVLSLSSLYASFQKAEYDESRVGYSRFFQNLDKHRIVIKKNDGTSFTEDDYNEIAKVENIDYIVKDDLSLDTATSLNGNEYYFYGMLQTISNFTGKLDIGRMPEEENEIILEVYKDDYYVSKQKEQILDIDFQFDDLYDSISGKNSKIKVVGIVFTKEMNFNGFSTFYVNDSLLNSIVKKRYLNYTTISFVLNNVKYDSYSYDVYNQLIPSTRVPAGQVYISEFLNYSCTNGCLNKDLIINISNIYYSDSITLKIKNAYTENSFKNLTGLNYKEYNGALFINNEDYNKLIDKGFFQSSVFVKNDKLAEKAVEDLEKLDLKALYILDTKEAITGQVEILRIFKVITLGIVIIALFFVSYFIIKVILKSRNIYFSTLRILGASGNALKRILNIELITLSNIAYFTFISLILLIKNNIIKGDYLADVITYLGLYEYILLYIIVFAMTYLISIKFAKAIFKKAALVSYREEV